jgi:predicted nucleotidyltransferase
MKRITPKLLEEARKMRIAWIESTDDGRNHMDIEWIEREVASTLGVSYEALVKKI